MVRFLICPLTQVNSFMLLCLFSTTALFHKKLAHSPQIPISKTTTDTLMNSGRLFGFSFPLCGGLVYRGHSEL